MARTATRLQPVHHWAIDLVRSGSDLFLAISVVVFLALAIGPHLFGYRTESMITGSMAPYIRPGDVIVIKAIPADQLAVGDVISYQIPLNDRRVVTHRVVEVNHTADGITFRTKGDANQSADPWTVQVIGSQAWTVRTVVPAIGHVIRWLREPYVSRTMRWIVPWFLVVAALQFIWGQGRSERRQRPRAVRRPVLRLIPRASHRTRASGQ